MLLVPSDPPTARTQGPDLVYVWECLTTPGLYGLSANRSHLEYQTARWQFRGELSATIKLAGLDRAAVKRRTGNGWPMIVRVTPGDPRR